MVYWRQSKICLNPGNKFFQNLPKWSFYIIKNTLEISVELKLSGNIVEFS